LPGNYVGNFAWTENARAAMLTQSLRGRARQ
jgi:hypothetical protein